MVAAALGISVATKASQSDNQRRGLPKVLLDALATGDPVLPPAPPPPVPPDCHSWDTRGYSDFEAVLRGEFTVQQEMPKWLRAQPRVDWDVHTGHRKRPAAPDWLGSPIDLSLSPSLTGQISPDTVASTKSRGSPSVEASASTALPSPSPPTLPSSSPTIFSSSSAASPPAVSKTRASFLSSCSDPASRRAPAAAPLGSMTVGPPSWIGQPGVRKPKTLRPGEYQPARLQIEQSSDAGGAYRNAKKGGFEQDHSHIHRRQAALGILDSCEKVLKIIKEATEPETEIPLWSTLFGADAAQAEPKMALLNYTEEEMAERMEVRDRIRNEIKHMIKRRQKQDAELKRIEGRFIMQARHTTTLTSIASGGHEEAFSERLWNYQIMHSQYAAMAALGAHQLCRFKVFNAFQGKMDLEKKHMRMKHHQWKRKQGGWEADNLETVEAREKEKTEEYRKLKAEYEIAQEKHANLQKKKTGGLEEAAAGGLEEVFSIEEEEDVVTSASEQRGSQIAVADQLKMRAMNMMKDEKVAKNFARLLDFIENGQASMRKLISQVNKLDRKEKDAMQRLQEEVEDECVEQVNRMVEKGEVPKDLLKKVREQEQVSFVGANEVRSLQRRRDRLLAIYNSLQAEIEATALKQAKDVAQTKAFAEAISGGMEPEAAQEHASKIAALATSKIQEVFQGEEVKKMFLPPGDAGAAKRADLARKAAEERLAELNAMQSDLNSSVAATALGVSTAAGQAADLQAAMQARAAVSDGFTATPQYALNMQSAQQGLPQSRQSMQQAGRLGSSGNVQFSPGTPLSNKPGSSMSNKPGSSQSRQQVEDMLPQLQNLTKQAEQVVAEIAAGLRTANSGCDDQLLHQLEDSLGVLTTAVGVIVEHSTDPTVPQKPGDPRSSVPLPADAISKLQEGFANWANIGSQVGEQLQAIKEPLQSVDAIGAAEGESTGSRGSGGVAQQGGAAPQAVAELSEKEKADIEAEKAALAMLEERIQKNVEEAEKVEEANESLRLRKAELMKELAELQAGMEAPEEVVGKPAKESKEAKKEAADAKKREAKEAKEEEKEAKRVEQAMAKETAKAVKEQLKVEAKETKKLRKVITKLQKDLDVEIKRVNKTEEEKAAAEDELAKLQEQVSTAAAAAIEVDKSHADDQAEHAQSSDEPTPHAAATGGEVGKPNAEHPTEHERLSASSLPHSAQTAPEVSNAHADGPIDPGRVSDGLRSPKKLGKSKSGAHVDENDMVGPQHAEGQDAKKIEHANAPDAEADSTTDSAHAKVEEGAVVEDGQNDPDAKPARGKLLFKSLAKKVINTNNEEKHASQALAEVAAEKRDFVCKESNLTQKQLLKEKTRTALKLQLHRQIKQHKKDIFLRTKVLVSFLNPEEVASMQKAGLISVPSKPGDKKADDVDHSHEAEEKRLKSRLQMLLNLINFWSRRLEQAGILDDEEDHQQHFDEHGNPIYLDADGVWQKGWNPNAKLGPVEEGEDGGWRNARLFDAEYVGPRGGWADLPGGKSHVRDGSFISTVHTNAVHKGGKGALYPHLHLDSAHDGTGERGITPRTRERMGKGKSYVFPSGKGVYGPSGAKGKSPDGGRYIYDPRFSNVGKGMGEGDHAYGPGSEQSGYGHLSAEAHSMLHLHKRGEWGEGQLEHDGLIYSNVMDPRAYQGGAKGTKGKGHLKHDHVYHYNGPQSNSFENDDLTKAQRVKHLSQGLARPDKKQIRLPIAFEGLMAGDFARGYNQQYRKALLTLDKSKQTAEQFTTGLGILGAHIGPDEEQMLTRLKKRALLGGETGWDSDGSNAGAGSGLTHLNGLMVHGHRDETKRTRSSVLAEYKKRASMMSPAGEGKVGKVDSVGLSLGGPSSDQVMAADRFVKDVLVTAKVPMVRDGVLSNMCLSLEENERKAILSHIWRIFARPEPVQRVALKALAKGKVGQNSPLKHVKTGKVARDKLMGIAVIIGKRLWHLTEHMREQQDFSHCNAWTGKRRSTMMFDAAGAASGEVPKRGVRQSTLLTMLDPSTRASAVLGKIEGLRSSVLGQDFSDLVTSNGKPRASLGAEQKVTEKSADDNSQQVGKTATIESLEHKLRQAGKDVQLRLRLMGAMQTANLNKKDPATVASKAKVVEKAQSAWGKLKASVKEDTQKKAVISKLLGLPKMQLKPIDTANDDDESPKTPKAVDPTVRLKQMFKEELARRPSTDRKAIQDLYTDGFKFRRSQSAPNLLSSFIDTAAEAPQGAFYEATSDGRDTFERRCSKEGAYTEEIHEQWKEITTQVRQEKEELYREYREKREKLINEHLQQQGEHTDAEKPAASPTANRFKNILLKDKAKVEDDTRDDEEIELQLKVKAGRNDALTQEDLLKMRKERAELDDDPPDDATPSGNIRGLTLLKSVSKFKRAMHKRQDGIYDETAAHGQAGQATRTKNRLKSLKKKLAVDESPEQTSVRSRGLDFIWDMAAEQKNETQEKSNEQEDDDEKSSSSFASSTEDEKEKEEEEEDAPPEVKEGLGLLGWKKVRVAALVAQSMGRMSSGSIASVLTRRVAIGSEESTEAASKAVAAVAAVAALEEARKVIETPKKESKPAQPESPKVKSGVMFFEEEPKGIRKKAPEEWSALGQKNWARAQQHLAKSAKHSARFSPLVKQAESEPMGVGLGISSFASTQAGVAAQAETSDKQEQVGKALKRRLAPAAPVSSDHASAEGLAIGEHRDRTHKVQAFVQASRPGKPRLGKSKSDDNLNGLPPKKKPVGNLTESSSAPDLRSAFNVSSTQAILAPAMAATRRDEDTIEFDVRSHVSGSSRAPESPRAPTSPRAPSRRAPSSRTPSEPLSPTSPVIKIASEVQSNATLDSPRSPRPREAQIEVQPSTATELDLVIKPDPIRRLEVPEISIEKPATAPESESPSRKPSKVITLSADWHLKPHRQLIDDEPPEPDEHKDDQGPVQRKGPLDPYALIGLPIEVIHSEIRGNLMLFQRKKDKPAQAEPIEVPVQVQQTLPLPKHPMPHMMRPSSWGRVAQKLSGHAMKQPPPPTGEAPTHSPEAPLEPPNSFGKTPRRRLGREGEPLPPTNIVAKPPSPQTAAQLEANDVDARIAAQCHQGVELPQLVGAAKHAQPTNSGKNSRDGTDKMPHQAVKLPSIDPRTAGQVAATGLTPKELRQLNSMRCNLQDRLNRINACAARADAAEKAEQSSKSGALTWRGTIDRQAMEGTPPQGKAKTILSAR